MRALTATCEVPPLADIRAPAMIRTVADIEWLLAHPAAAKRLPRDGLPVVVAGLDEESRTRFRAQIQRYAGACGCAAGAATFIVTGALVVAHAASLGADHAWVAMAWEALCGAILILCNTFVAKLLSVQIARRRFYRVGRRLIDALAGGSGPGSKENSRDL